MAIGTISSPASWTLGTVVSPTWLQTVQDDCNLAYQALGASTVSGKSLVLDGVGNQAVAPSPAQLIVSQSALADNALALFKDQAGHVRNIVDHNGFLSKRVDDLVDRWLYVATLSGVQSSVAFGTLWTQISTLNSNITTNNATFSNSSYNSTFITVNPGTANTNSAELVSNLGPRSATDIVWVLETDVGMSAVGANNQNYSIGVATSLAPSAGQNGMWISRNTGVANWQCSTSDAATLNTVDSGVAVTASAYPNFRFKMEYHGSTTPYGVAAVEGGSANTAKVRFFINDTRVATSATHLPTVGTLMSIVLGGSCSGAASATATFGPVSFIWARALSLPAV